SHSRLATGIVNVYSRSPALIAMAAATLDELSEGRAVLGLGVSGARVIEGFHGERMRRPLRQLREVTEAVRALLRRDPAGYSGELVRIAPGFTAAVGAARQAGQAQRRDAAINAIPDEMVDAIAACGPAPRVRARLDELRAAGADLPIAFLPMESSPAQVRRTIAAIA